MNRQANRIIFSDNATAERIQRTANALRAYSQRIQNYVGREVGLQGGMRVEDNYPNNVQVPRIVYMGLNNG